MVIKSTIIAYGSKFSTKDLIRLLYIKTKNMKKAIFLNMKEKIYHEYIRY